MPKKRPTVADVRANKGKYQYTMMRVESWDELAAAEAAGVGFVNEVVAGDAIEARVTELATSIAGNAPLTIRASKEAIRRLLVQRRLDGPANTDIMLMAYLSEDFKEGVSAFLEKRPAQWKGR